MGKVKNEISQRTYQLMGQINLTKIKSVKFSLMEKEKDNKDNKADFIVHASVFFKMPDHVEISEDLFEDFIESMYIDLTTNQKISDKGYLGLWVEHDDNIFENSMSIDALNAIKQYSDIDINPIYEFFKITLNLE